jgi:RNA polymerase sigma-70 factor (ECF subfamily)
VEANALDNLAAEELFQLITQLPTGYRTVFNLYVVEGLKHTEIAQELGISEGTSKSQLNKARMMLQQLLAAKNNETNAQRKTK